MASQPTRVMAQDGNADSDTYFQEVTQLQADLNAGKVADVAKRLDATDKNLRGIEADYLQRRVQQAPASGGAVPDLLQVLRKPPDVEMRYGVLNGVNRQLAFICRDGGIRVHNLAAPKDAPNLVKHPQGSAVWTGTFSRDGNVFFTGHQNGEVLVWDANKWQVSHTVAVGASTPIRELAAAPDGSAFAAEGAASVELWSLANDKPKKVADIGERYNFGEGLAFSPKGDMLATGGMFDILLRDATSGKELRRLSHASYTMGLEFSPDGKWIASAPRGNVNKFLAVFAVTKDEPLFNAGPFANYVAGMAFTPDGKRILATGCEKVVRLFDSKTGQVALSFPRPGCGSVPAVTHDGRLMGWNEAEGFLFIDLGKQSDGGSKPEEVAN